MLPNPHPSSRVESGTDSGVEASTGLQVYKESNNGAVAIADSNSALTSSNEDGSIVEPGTNAGKEKNPNTTSEATDGFQDEEEHEDSSPHKPTFPTSEDNNDPGSVSGTGTTPPGTPDV
eukprot:9267659-Ditylum_brightwellii.AAC.1